jgi:hypothetical protein
VEERESSSSKKLNEKTNEEGEREKTNAKKAVGNAFKPDISLQLNTEHKEHM